jgi:hypothetical protein
MKTKSLVAGVVVALAFIVGLSLYVTKHERRTAIENNQTDVVRHH